LLYCKFPEDYDSERILKIGLYLTKLWVDDVGLLFWPTLYYDLETGVRGHSMSSKAALFDRARTTLNSSSIVNMPPSITVFEI